MDDFFNIDLTQLSIFNFIGLAIQGAVIFAVLWLFKNYLVLILIKSPIRRKKIIDKIPPVYTLIWIVFALYALYIIIKPFPLFGVVLSLVFIYLGRGYLVNLIHGLFFRLKGDIVLGQKIAIDSYSGFVFKMKTFDLEIQNKEGEIIQVPYGNLANKQLVKKDFSSDFSSFKFVVITDENTTELELKHRLLQQPWITSVFQPKITKNIAVEGKSKFNIVVYSLDEKYHALIENDLKMYLAK